MMRRTPLKRAQIQRGTSTIKRKPMKRSSRRKHKIDGHHDAKMLAACRGEPCFLAIPGVCMGEAGKDTVVPCHSNSSEHGKGLGLKAKDEFTVPGCLTCHSYIDQGPAPKELKRMIFDNAYYRWSKVRDEKLRKGKE